MIRRKKTNSRRRIKRNQRKGSAIVEFAIIANILFVTVFTSMEFARLNMVRNLSQDAAYFAARDAIVPGGTEEDAIAEAERIMGSLITNGYTVEVEDIGIETEDIVVTVSVDLSAVALFAPLFLPNANIPSTARMRTERYDGFFEQ